MSAPTTSILLNKTTPAAPSGQQNVVFQSDGATPQQSISAYDQLMVGDTGSGGKAGNVPAPAAGDAAAGKFLKADGTFAVPPGSGTPGSGLFSGLITTIPTQAGTGLTTAMNHSGTYAASDNSIGIGLTDVTSQAGFYIEGQLGPYPTAPFTRVMLASQLKMANGSNGVAFIIAASPTGKVMYGLTGLFTANSPTSFNSTIQAALPLPVPFVWFKLVDNGTTIQGFFSADGVLYVPAWPAQTKSTSFLGSTGFNYLGYGLVTQGGGIASTLMAWQ